MIRPNPNPKDLNRCRPKLLRSYITYYSSSHFLHILFTNLSLNLWDPYVGSTNSKMGNRCDEKLLLLLFLVKKKEKKKKSKNLLVI